MIIIDTNMLLYAVENKVNVIKQLKLEDKSVAITDATMLELERLSWKSGKVSANAKVALEIIKSERLRIVKTSVKNVDESILHAASEHKASVATNDKALIGKLKEHGIKIYILRQGKLVMHIQ